MLVLTIFLKKKKKKKKGKLRILFIVSTVSVQLHMLVVALPCAHILVYDHA